MANGKINVTHYSGKWFLIQNGGGVGSTATFHFLQAHRYLFSETRVSEVATALILEVDRLPKFIEYVGRKGFEIVRPGQQAA